MENFTDIFTAYYQLFRGEAVVPSTTDDEYTLGLTLANRALNRWATYDATYWKELWSTNQTDGTGVQTITTGTTAYAAPTNMREAGGIVQIKNSDGSIVQEYPIIEPQERQFKSEDSTYCYFTGNPTAGFTLNLNPAPDASTNGMDIEYTYYKKPTEYTTGASTSEIPNTYFVVHNMLAQRFQIERNYGGYQIAKRDSEEELKNMHQDNDSGTWANPWALSDNSGSSWGA
jgi:hypothetical protein